MKVGIFYNSISNPNKFQNKVELMNTFKAGVVANGDTVVEYKNNNLPTRSLDAGFVLGYTLENNFRKKIIDRLRAFDVPQIFVDSNILNYARQEHEWHRYSLNSVYPNDGVYFFNNLDFNKWKNYSQWHGVSLKPWRTQGTHILVLGQRPKGWNMFGTDQGNWLETTIDAISQLTDKPIVVRMHPGDSSQAKQIDKLIKRYKNSIKISTHANIRDDLVDCWCTVGYNSTPNVVAAIEGVPGYIQDPVHSWAKDVAFTDLSQILDPPLPSRDPWIHSIANIHWSKGEVQSGQLWAAIKQYISSAR